MIDRSLSARNRGRFVLDLRSKRDESGDEWLRNAAILLPAERVVLEQTDKVLYGEKQVIAYASWGSNDPNRKQRYLGFEWLPGAIATEYVSTQWADVRKTAQWLEYRNLERSRILFRRFAAKHDSRFYRGRRYRSIRACG